MGLKSHYKKPWSDGRFPDLTSEERQLLLDIRRRKAELLQEISQLKEEITEISTEIDQMDTEEGWVSWVSRGLP